MAAARSTLAHVPTTSSAVEKFGAQYAIRNQEPAETNGGHWQAASPKKYRDQRGLVEEFILEFEGDRKNCDVTRWDRFTDIKDITKEMLKRLEAHFEKWLNPWNESQLQKSGKRSPAQRGLQSGEGEGGVGKCSRHLAGDDVDACDRLPSKKQRQQNVATSSS
jgi:hypothetical protein